MSVIVLQVLLVVRAGALVHHPILGAHIVQRRVACGVSEVEAQTTAQSGDNSLALTLDGFPLRPRL